MPALENLLLVQRTGPSRQACLVRPWQACLVRPWQACPVIVARQFQTAGQLGEYFPSGYSGPSGHRVWNRLATYPTNGATKPFRARAPLGSIRRFYMVKMIATDHQSGTVWPPLWCAGHPRPRWWTRDAARWRSGKCWPVSGRRHGQMGQTGFS